MTDNVTLAYDDDTFRRYDPDGDDRTVTMPEAISAHYGVTYVIAHTGTANTIELSDGSTFLTLYPGEVGLAQCFSSDGTADWAGSKIVNAYTLTAAAIAEAEAASGVTIDGLRIMDSTIKPVAGGSAFVDLTAVATGEADLVLKDNLASAFEIREAANSYLILKTTNDAERITFGKIVAGAVTTVSMADAAHTLVLGTAGAAQTKLLGNIVVADPDSAGASENLQLPAAATLSGVELTIVNSGGEGIVVLGEAAATCITLDTAQHGKVVSNGTAWFGFMGAIT
jgi:hypothetical protein